MTRDKLTSCGQSCPLNDQLWQNPLLFLFIPLAFCADTVNVVVVAVTAKAWMDTSYYSIQQLYLTFLFSYSVKIVNTIKLKLCLQINYLPFQTFNLSTYTYWMLISETHFFRVFFLLFPLPLCEHAVKMFVMMISADANCYHS